jgi:hypothetical protein
MLLNRLTEEELMIIGKFVDKKKFTAPKEPREVAEKRLYLTEDKKQPYIPTNMLMSCFIQAGIYLKMDGKRQMSTAKSTLLPGFVSIEDMYIMIVQPGTKKAPVWEVDMRQGRNPNGGEAVCIIRPRFDKWCLNFSMQIDNDQIDPSRIRELIDIAGSRCGLGDFRPQRKGIFGQFKVGCWDAGKKMKDLPIAAE